MAPTLAKRCLLGPGSQRANKSACRTGWRFVLKTINQCDQAKGLTLNLLSLCMEGRDLMVYAPAPRARPLPSVGYLAKALPAVLTPFDGWAAHLVVILWLINGATAALAGPVGLSYWLLGALLFFVPSLFAVGHLARLFPGDGGLYLWTYQALAHSGQADRAAAFWSFFAGVCSWVVGPLALVTGASALLSFLQGMLPGAWFARVLSHPWQQGMLMAGLVLLMHLVACQRLRVVQHLINVTALANLLALLLIALAGLRFLLSGHPSATAFTPPGVWLPTPATLPLFGLICLGYLGPSIHLTMRGELAPDTHPGRAITRPLVWSGLLVVPGYLVVTAALLVVRGPALATSTNLNFELISVVDHTLGKAPGNVALVALLFFFLLSPVYYHVAASRLPLAAAIDGRLPAKLGRLNQNRVPVPALWLQTLVALALLALIDGLTPLIAGLGQPAQLASNVYNLALASITMFFVLATLFLHVDLFAVALRGTAQRIAPRLAVWGCILLGASACLFVLADTLLNSWTPTLSNATWTLALGAVLGVILFALAIGSMLATSEAAWQQWREEPAARPALGEPSPQPLSPPCVRRKIRG
jgi:amino acid transporter